MNVSARRHLSLDDFFAGILAVLKLRGVRVISVHGDRFYRAIEASYEKLESRASDYNVEPRFAIYLDPIYEDSPVIQEAIAGAILRNIASISVPGNHDLQIRLGSAHAHGLLSRLPGGGALYGEIVDEFLAKTPYVAAV
ncbi:hypothetical protein JCM9534A_12300 [Catenuloplanes indicus JCM 9534]